MTTDQQTPTMEDDSEEMGKGDVPTKLPEQCRLWVTTAVAKKAMQKRNSYVIWEDQVVV